MNAQNRIWKRMTSTALALLLALPLCLGLTTPAEAKTELSEFAAAWLSGELRPVSDDYDILQGTDLHLVQNGSGDRYGLVDKQGNIVLPVEYQSIGGVGHGVSAGYTGFQNGLMHVEKDGMDGLIDMTGSVVVPCEYYEIGEWSEGLAAVNKNDKWGYINQSGSFVIQPQYDALFSGLPFSEGLAPVIKEKINTSSSNWAYIDQSGAEVITLDGYFLAGSFKNGMADVESISANGNKYAGVIDSRGNMVLSPGYYITHGILTEDLIVVENSDFGIGVIDRDNISRPLFTLPYDDAYALAYGLIHVLNENADGQYVHGLVDQRGKEIIPCEYSSVEILEGTDLIRFEKDGKSGLIDPSGTVVLPCEYNIDDYNFAFYDGLALVSREAADGYRKYGFIDTTGALVIPCEYDNAYNFSEGLAVVGKEDTERGNTDSSAGSEAAGGVSSLKDCKYGYIDTTGALVIPCEYDRAFAFSEGLAFAYMNGDEGWNWSVMDKNGTVVFTPELSGYTSDLGFVSGVAKTYTSGFFGDFTCLLDRSGVVIAKDRTSMGSIPILIIGVLIVAATVLAILLKRGILKFPAKKTAPASVAKQTIPAPTSAAEQAPPVALEVPPAPATAPPPATPETPPTPAQGIKYCSFCGKQIAAGSRFCSGCGKQLPEV